MSLLIFAYRKLDIMQRKSDLNYRLMNLTRKLSDLQQYAANIGDGSVSMSDMMNTPGSMFGRQLMYMQYAHNTALFGAQQQMQMMQPQIAMQMSQMQDPNMQAMYQQWIFKIFMINNENKSANKNQNFLTNKKNKFKPKKQNLKLN